MVAVSITEPVELAALVVLGLELSKIAAAMALPAHPDQVAVAVAGPLDHKEMEAMDRKPRAAV